MGHENAARLYRAHAMWVNLEVTQNSHQQFFTSHSLQNDEMLVAYAVLAIR